MTITRQDSFPFRYIYYKLLIKAIVNTSIYVCHTVQNITVVDSTFLVDFV